MTMAKQISHGSQSTYNNHGCRCAACTEAHRVYQAALQAKRVARGHPAVHNASAYTNHGCRCPVCTEAARIARRECRARNGR